MRRIAITFCHGINNGPEERASLQDWFKAQLMKHNMLTMFAVPNSNEHYVDVAEWESVGDFFMDIAALSKKEWCDAAVKKVGDKLLRVQEKLLNDSSFATGEKIPYHIIVAHSMGSPLSVSALADLTSKNTVSIPTFLITIGNPLGSRNAAFKTYLQWCTKRISWWNPESSLKVESWTDIYNSDDPVCCDPILNVMSNRGYAPVRGVTKSLRFDWPGRPPVSNPLAEHSSYVDGKLLYDTIFDLLKGSQNG